MQESFFVQEEIARENILPIELLEEVAGRNSNFAKWLVRMLRFPFGEFFASFGEILKIQGLKSGNEFRHVAERWTGGIGIRPSVADGRREEQQGHHAMASPTHLSFSSEKARQEARFAVHRRAIVRIGKQHAHFGREALRQYSGMRHSSNGRGDPRHVNQRKRKHFRKNRSIIGMPDVAKWSRGHHAEARGIHDLNVPVFPQRAYTHQRTALAAKKTANIGAASHGIKGRRRRTTSSAAPS